MANKIRRRTEKITNRSTELDLLTGPIVKKVLLFAIPLVLTGMLQQLFVAADTAIVGQFCGKEAMAAVGSNTPIVGLLVNFFVGVSIGANVVIARFIGQGKTDRAKQAVHTAQLIGFCGGVILAIIGEIITEPIIELMGVPANVYDYSILYLRIFFAGMPFLMLYNFEAAIFRAVGDSRTPLKCLTIGGIFNVVANLFFVLVLDMTVDGVAIATVMSSIISFALMFREQKRRSGILEFDRARLKLDRSILVSILKIGVPAGLQSVVFSISNLVVQSAVNSLGSDIMAASSAAFNIEIMAYYLVNGFTQASTTFISQNYGARNYKRCREIVRKIFIIDQSITIVFSALVLLVGRSLLMLFNPDTVIIEYGYIRLLYMMIFEFLNGMMDLFSGILRGLGKSLTPAIVTLVGVCGVRIVWIFTIFAARPSLACLMTCYPVSWVITSAILVVIYIKTAKRLLKD